MGRPVGHGLGVIVGDAVLVVQGDVGARARVLSHGVNLTTPREHLLPPKKQNCSQLNLQFSSIKRNTTIIAFHRSTESSFYQPFVPKISKVDNLFLKRRFAAITSGISCHGNLLVS